jgi:membrane-associated phospholipid phosphatase
MRRSLPALVVAVACALAAAAVWLVAARTGWGAAIDERTLTGFAGLDRPRVEEAAEAMASLVDPPGFAAFATLVVGAALVRARFRLACVVAVVLVAANVSTQALKGGLPAADAAVALGAGSGTWPSGHATAAMALALCAVLVASRRLRPFVAAAGGLAAIGVAYSLLLLGWHPPSDIAGGYLVAMGWTALGVAVVNAAPAPNVRSPSLGTGRLAGPPVAAAALAGLAASAVALTRPGPAVAYAGDHTVFVAAALALGAAAVAAATVTAVAVRDA